MFVCPALLPTRGPLRTSPDETESQLSGPPDQWRRRRCAPPKKQMPMRTRRAPAASAKADARCPSDEVPSARAMPEPKWLKTTPPHESGRGRSEICSRQHRPELVKYPTHARGRAGPEPQLFEPWLEPKWLEPKWLELKKHTYEISRNTRRSLRPVFFSARSMASHTCCSAPRRLCH